MSIQPVGSRVPAQAYADLDEACAGNPMAHVARVLMEAKDQTEETEDLALDGARSRVEKATAEEVASMHDAADEMFRGALTGAVLTAAGAGLQAASIGLGPAVNQNSSADALQASRYADVGGKLMTTGAPLANQVFQSRAEDDRADAAQHRGDAAMAQVDLSRADGDRKRAIGDRDDVRGGLRSALKEQHEAHMEATRAIRA